MSRPGDLPGEAYATALAELPGMGPRRLVSLLREDSPELVWQRVVNGEIGRPEQSPSLPAVRPRTTWADVAARRDVGRRWDAIRDAQIEVAYFGHAGFPPALLGDPDPPAVLFWRGDLGILARPTVAIVGTRQSTSYGRSVAAQLGRDLAECGVCVVSGLALGIDGAAHHGVLMAHDGTGPLGVAASGVDVPYPRRHAELWRRVAAAGAVISETAPGQPAQSWRFPARNRVIAGLARAVVVVESHTAGGSMLTVAAAAERGVDVLAVPGPVTSPASSGTNQLLYEGLSPARHAGDVLAALGDLRPWPPSHRPPSHQPPTPQAPTPHAGRGETRSTGPRGDPIPSRAETVFGLDPALVPHLRRGVHLDPPERRVLNSIDRTPTSTSVIAERTGLPLGALSVVLLHLEALSVIRGQGMWWERCDQL